MRPVRPPRLVWVPQDDTWHEGFLEAWRSDGDGWRAFVRYSVNPGMRYLTWVSGERVRPA